jgi:hypothetical protein
MARHEATNPQQEEATMTTTTTTATTAPKVACQKCGSGYLRLTWQTIVSRRMDVPFGTKYRLSCVLCGWDTHHWDRSPRPAAS